MLHASCITISSVVFRFYGRKETIFTPICRSHARANAQEKRDQIEEIEMGKKQREKEKKITTLKRDHRGADDSPLIIIPRLYAFKRMRTTEISSGAQSNAGNRSEYY